MAKEIGFSFDAGGDHELRSSGLPLFKGAELTNVLRGLTGGADTFLVDVNKGSEGDMPQTVACFHLAETIFRDFKLSPENAVRRIAQAFGAQDIDFEESPAFSRRYRLRGASPEPAVRHLFTSEALRFFEKNPGWTVEGCGG